ncbi:hypothetical protein TNCV_1437942 [Trichonephila clavipes]|nr:hypothetical protein TNCV_1437942 [Trichonephila clavipes]
MSKQRDIPESMAWGIIGRLRFEKTQIIVVDAVEVARSVIWRNSPRGPRPTVPVLVYVNLGAEVHKQIFRSDGQSDAKTQALVLIYRPPEWMKGGVDLAQPGI